MQPAEIRNKVKEIIANVTGIPAEAISDSASFEEDLDLDSLSLLEVGVDVDYAFRLGLPEEVLQGLRTLDEVVALVLERLESVPAAAVA